MDDVYMINYNDMPRMPYVEIFDKENRCITRTNNVLNFAWIQYQIVLNRWKGCYVAYDGRHYAIDWRDGTVHKAPQELFPYDIIDSKRVNLAFDNYLEENGPYLNENAANELASSLMDMDVMPENII